MHSTPLEKHHATTGAKITSAVVQALALRFTGRFINTQAERFYFYNSFELMSFENVAQLACFTIFVPAG